MKSAEFLRLYELSAVNRGPLGAREVPSEVVATMLRYVDDAWELGRREPTGREHDYDFAGWALILLEDADPDSARDAAQWMKECREVEGVRWETLDSFEEYAVVLMTNLSTKLRNGTLRH